MSTPSVRTLLAAAAFLVYAVALLRALNIDGLSSLASDSVHYLLMARHLSPWGDADPVTAAAFATQDYPPLFGFVLGLVGAGNDFRAAHVLNGALLLTALLLLRRYAAGVTGSPGIALAMTAIFAISPGAWLNSLDVLSENLYLLLSLIILLRTGEDADPSPRSLALTGVLVAALILTRTVGLAMLAAIAGAGMIRGQGIRGKALAAGIPLGIGIAALLAVEFISAAGVPDQYLQGFNRIAEGESPRGRIDTGVFLLSQARVLYEAWLGNWLYYWNAATVFNTVCFSIAGLLGVAGTVQGLRAGRVDALYLLAYLVVILVWPHPGQMTRFAYPVAPLVLTLGLATAVRMAATIPHHRRVLAAPLFILLLAVAVLPSPLYTWHRFQAGRDIGLNRMTEFYRLPDLRAATLEATVQAQIAADLVHIGTLLPAGTAILYYEPAYVALLANQRSIRLPPGGNAGQVRTLARESGASHVLLTRIDPRHWRAGDDRFDGVADLAGWGEPLYSSASGIDGKPVSMLLRIAD